MHESTSTTDPAVRAALAGTDASPVEPGVWVGRLANGRRLLITEPAGVDVYGIVRDAADWLDAPVDARTGDLASLIYRVIQEVREAAGSTQTPTPDAARLHHATITALADRAMVALIAIESCDVDASTALARAAGRIAALMGVPPQPTANRH